MRSMTLMPVSKTFFWGSTFSNSGGSRWIGHESPENSASGASSAWPQTLKM